MSWSSFDNWLMTDPRDYQPNAYDLAEELDIDDLFQCATEDMPIDFWEYLNAKDFIDDDNTDEEAYEIAHELLKAKDEKFRDALIDFFYDDSSNLEWLVQKYCPSYDPYHDF